MSDLGHRRRADELQPGQWRRRTWTARIVVFNIDGEYYAIERCLHA
jgi:nitrite reductase/ring-hydroxylating ferredoxin subunit